MANRQELQQQLSTLLERRAALAAELKDLLVRIRGSRDILGNPFYYSHPKNPAQSQANYTRYASLAVTVPMSRQLRQLDADIAALRAAMNDSRAEDDDGNSR